MPVRVHDVVLANGNIAEVTQGDMAEGDFFMCVQFSKHQPFNGYSAPLARALLPLE
jgi:hypothetical protein